jgi:hypothetical protein
MYEQTKKTVAGLILVWEDLDDPKQQALQLGHVECAQAIPVV